MGELNGGASKSKLCEYVIKAYPQQITVSKFRYALGNAIELKLVIVVMAEDVVRKHRRRRSSGSALITIPMDMEDIGIPDRVECDDTMVDELEKVAANLQRNSKEFAAKDLKCYYCNRLFYNDRGMRQHCMQSHYEAFGYAHKCNDCTHKFKKESQLEHHKKYLHATAQ